MLVALAATVIAVLGLSACQGSARETDGLRIAQIGAVEINRALLAASGEDRSLGFEIDWQLYGSGPAMLEAAGSWDAGQIGDTPMLFAAAADRPVTVVAAGTAFDPATESIGKIVVPAGSPVSSPADLKGKKVGYVEGSVLQYILVVALDSAGMTLADLTAVNLDAADAAAALRGGDIDALVAGDPQLATLVADGAEVIGDSAGRTSSYYFLAAADTALADAETSSKIERFADGLNRAMLWADSHRGEWAQEYAELTGLDIAVAKAVVARAQYTPVPIDSALYANQQDQAAVFTELDLLPELNIGEQFDDRFNNTLVTAGGNR